MVNYRRDEAAAAETVAAIKSAAAAHWPCGRHLWELEGVDALADAALAAFGCVDIIVHNAGVASRGNTVADSDPAELQRLMMTHTFSAARLCQQPAAADARARPRAHRDDLASEVAHMRANGPRTTWQSPRSRPSP